jgi:hypothetical protein
MNLKRDKRRFQRVNLSGNIAFFMDHGCYYKGILEDLSYDGFRVTFPSLDSQLIFWPNLSIFHSATIWRIRKCRIAISTSIVSNNAHTEYSSDRTRKSYFVSAYPRWKRQKDTQLEIGFKIPESSVGWKFFVHQKMPRID